MADNLRYVWEIVLGDEVFEVSPRGWYGSRSEALAAGMQRFDQIVTEAPADFAEAFTLTVVDECGDVVSESRARRL